jgi:hypothetical protein
MKRILITIILLALVSCEPVDPNKQIDEGRVTGEVYESKEIGWKIEIPNGWKIMTKDKIESNEQKGGEAIEKTYGQAIDVTSLKHLINFQKDRFNIFMSTTEPFKEEFPGEFEINNRKIYSLLYETFLNQGIKVDTSSGEELIRDLKFETFKTTIYSPEGEIIMNQILYSKLIKGYSFGVTICYNNLADKKVLIRALKSSRFE